MKKTYYAALSPRGFSNEIDVLAFASKQDRDAFVKGVPRTEYSGYYQAMVYTDSQSARAWAVTAREVEQIIPRSERRYGYGYGGRFVRPAWDSPLTLAEYFAESVIPAGTTTDDAGREEVAA